MPQRQGTKKIDASEVQGEGAFVVISPITYGESKEARTVGEISENESVARGEQIIIQHVKAWNWADEHGVELPLPSADPRVLLGMTTDEIAFLLNRITGDPNVRGG